MTLLLILLAPVFALLAHPHRGLGVIAAASLVILVATSALALVRRAQGRGWRAIFVAASTAAAVGAAARVGVMVLSIVAHTRCTITTGRFILACAMVLALEAAVFVVCWQLKLRPSRGVTVLVAVAEVLALVACYLVAGWWLMPWCQD